MEKLIENKKAIINFSKFFMEKNDKNSKFK